MSQQRRKCPSAIGKRKPERSIQRLLYTKLAKFNRECLCQDDYSCKSQFAFLIRPTPTDIIEETKWYVYLLMKYVLLLWKGSRNKKQAMCFYPSFQAIRNVFIIETSNFLLDKFMQLLISSTHFFEKNTTSTMITLTELVWKTSVRRRKSVTS
jgi:hypothetical protein